ncbi:hypothetical protein BEL05_13815 [Shewanella colwelliana]|uniref:Uncharacterized protein n=1 Tax=Shewanella colwelliana TaxID=23 RepID=A0A1E5ITE9_SHECO|nr:hypothetical protein BEL05_13815 [Shewanella colwelliana]
MAADIDGMVENVLDIFRHSLLACGSDVFVKRPRMTYRAQSIDTFPARQTADNCEDTSMNRLHLMPIATTIAIITATQE